MPVAGRPLLDYWLSLCRRHGVAEVLINVHHHADQVREFVEARQSDIPRIRIFPEERLLGSGGTLAANRDFVQREKEFLVLYADNLSNVNLETLVRFHRSHDGPVTMGLFHTAVPQQCGIVELDQDGRVLTFEEKPVRPRSDLASAGVMIMEPEVYELFPGSRTFDLGHDILPRLAGRMYGHVIEEYLQDIGTLEKYLDALREWRGFEDSRAGSGPGREVTRETP
jgi:mannose-1-phosphate guanylyltransferase